CKLPFIEQIRQSLKTNGMTSTLYADISPNPRDTEIAAGRELFRQGNHDGIIAIGGGSGMDGAKAVCLVANNDLNLWDFEYSQSAPDMTAQPPFPPLICVPTTAGTGAETESTAMITETARMMKLCIWHEQLKPSIALLDPEITVGLPDRLTAWTGCDAMVHAIEAYCVPDWHPLCDGIALEAMRLIKASLVTAVNQPSHMEARGGMLAGSCLAGIAFIKGLGLVHSISHMIGAEYDTHHGLTNAIVLPSVLRFNQPAITDKIPPMAQALGLTDTSFEAFYGAICDLLDQLHIPKNLTAIGVPADCAEAMASKAYLDIATTTNPRTASVADIQAIIEVALNHGR
ncbi:MAG: iron-containing alcohol dehydrogenase, partial [Gammaproteobacteria bacterium]|nr:iron-containing alcohol dehydrogenase [Gammaproteobacteria bacterium]